MDITDYKYMVYVAVHSHTRIIHHVDYVQVASMHQHLVWLEFDQHNYLVICVQVSHLPLDTQLCTCK